MQRFFVVLSVMLVVLRSVWPSDAAAHSGKARFHVIIDTDCAADDLRTLCMLLGNREVEVLAVTTSDGAIAPREAAERVAALLEEFHHQGIPVGVGRATLVTAPEWRSRSERIGWGSAVPRRSVYPPASALIAEALESEPEQVTIVALGALTNISDALAENPSLAGRIGRIVWYNDSVSPLSGANYDADPAAAEAVLRSGVDVTVVAAGADGRPIVTTGLIDTVASVRTRYADKIVGSHRTQPLSRLIEEGHLRVWDDLAAVYLFAPECFSSDRIDGHVTYCRLRDGSDGEVAMRIKAILQGKPDSESRVFYGFPTDSVLYAQDVAPLIGDAVERHGPSEWRAAVLTNELHGHLGIYATIGVKMGIRAREYFNIGVDDIAVITYAGSVPPVSCMNDGLQVGTGASVGHGLITVVSDGTPRPEAVFRFKNRSIRLALKPGYSRRIRADVRRGVELYGDQTEPYWQYVRGLALKYWLEFDRNEIFDLIE